MKLTFFTNFINHHQVHVADEFYRYLGENYHLVETTKMPESFKKAGYPDYNGRPYIVKAYESTDSQEKALKLSYESDIVIIGSAPDIYYTQRLRNNQIVFLYSERWFRKFQLGYLNPKVWWYWYSHYTRYRNNKYYMLCASAFTASDVSKIKAFPNKCFKWGYFTQVPTFDASSYTKRKKQAQQIKILWCARFISLKHPEMAINIAKYLKDLNYNFSLEMIGSGDLLEHTKALSKKYNVTKHVQFIGNIPNDIVLEKMKESHIFIFTSNKQEGWGAVLNEAMSSGCAVVAANQIGSVPFLITHKENGLIFESENQNDLNKNIKLLFDNPDLIYKLGDNARKTMQETWSPQTAVKNFFQLVTALQLDKRNPILDGPCSNAN